MAWLDGALQDVQGPLPQRPRAVRVTVAAGEDRQVIQRHGEFRVLGPECLFLQV